jgi:lipopolysaccharide export system permease protein
MKILLYIARQFNLYFITLLLIFLSIDLIFTSINESKSITLHDYNLKETILFIVLAIPRKMYMISPWISMLATLLSLGNIAKHSELIILQVSGLAPLKIARMVIISSLPLLTLLFISGEVIAPKADQLALKIRIRDTVIVTDNGIWSRKNNNFIQVMNITNKDSLQDVKIFACDQNMQIKSITHAAHANKINDTWLLDNVSTTILQNHTISVKKEKTMSYHDLINTNTLGNYTAKHLERLSITKLYTLAKQRAENNLNTREYQVALWKKLTQPLSIIMMIILATPLTFHSLRKSSVGAKLIIGVLIGFGFHIINSIAYSSAILADTHVALIILIPNLLMLAISILFFKKINR